MRAGETAIAEKHRCAKKRDIENGCVLRAHVRPSPPNPFYEYRFVNMWQLFSVKLILLGRRIGLCGDATRAPIQGLRAMGEVS